MDIITKTINAMEKPKTMTPYEMAGMAAVAISQLKAEAVITTDDILERTDKLFRLQGKQFNNAALVDALDCCLNRRMETMPRN